MRQSLGQARQSLGQAYGAYPSTCLNDYHKKSIKCLAHSELVCTFAADNKQV